MKKFVLFALLITALISCKKGSTPGEDATPQLDVTGFWVHADDKNQGVLQINFDTYKYYSPTSSFEPITNTYHLRQNEDGYYIYFDGFYGQLDFLKEFSISRVERPTPDELVLYSKSGFRIFKRKQ